MLIPLKDINTPILESKKKKKQPLFSEIVAIQLKNGLYTASTAIETAKSARISPPDSPRFANKTATPENQIRYGNGDLITIGNKVKPFKEAVDRQLDAGC